MHWNDYDKVWYLDPGDPGYVTPVDPTDQTANKYRGPGSTNPSVIPDLATNPQPSGSESGTGATGTSSGGGLSGGELPTDASAEGADTDPSGSVGGMASSGKGSSGKGQLHSVLNPDGTVSIIDDSNATTGDSTALGTYTSSKATPQGVHLYDYNTDVRGAQANQLAARKKQEEYIAALEAMAAGNGPSAAREQLKIATSRNMANQAGAAASARGINPALAQAMAMRAGTQANQSSAADAAFIRAQEQLAAQGLLGTALQQQRGADLNQYGTGSSSLNQQNANQTNLAIDQAKLNQSATAANAAQQAQITGMLLSAIAAAFPALASWAKDLISKYGDTRYDPNSMGAAPSTPIDMSGDVGSGDDIGTGDNGSTNTGDGDQTSTAPTMTGVTTNADGSQTQTFSDGTSVTIPAADSGSGGSDAPAGDSGSGGDSGDGGGGGGGGSGGTDPRTRHFAAGGEVFTPYGETIYSTEAQSVVPAAVKKLDLSAPVNTAKPKTYLQLMEDARSADIEKQKANELGILRIFTNLGAGLIPGGSALAGVSRGLDKGSSPFSDGGEVSSADAVRFATSLENFRGTKPLREQIAGSVAQSDDGSALRSLKADMIAEEYAAKRKAKEKADREFAAIINLDKYPRRLASGGRLAVHGGPVVGPPAPFPGDDRRNDLEPAILSEGEVVLPRTCADDPDKAAAFVMGLQSAKKSRRDLNFANVLQAADGAEVTDSTFPADTQSVDPNAGTVPAGFDLFDWMKNSRGNVAANVMASTEPEPAPIQTKPVIRRPAFDIPQSLLNQQSASNESKSSELAAGASLSPTSREALLKTYSKIKATPSSAAAPRASVSAALVPASPATPDPRSEALDLEMRGIDQQAAAAAAERQAQIAAAQAKIEFGKQVAAETATRQAEFAKQREAALADLQSQKIDPNRLWNSKSDFEKFSSIISLAIGGFLAGKDNGPNRALEALQRQIDNDVAAQREEINSKHNRYQELVRLGMDRDAAASRLASEKWTQVAAQAEITALQAGGDKEAATANLLKAQALNKAAGIDDARAQWGAEFDLKKRALAASMARTGGAAAAKGAGIPVRLHDGRTVVVGDKATAARLQAMVSARIEAGEVAKEAKGIIGKTGIGSPVQAARAAVGSGTTGVNAASVDENISKALKRFDIAAGLPPRTDKWFESAPVGTGGVSSLWTSQKTKQARLGDILGDMDRGINTLAEQAGGSARIDFQPVGAAAKTDEEE